MYTRPGHHFAQQLYYNLKVLKHQQAHCWQQRHVFLKREWSFKSKNREIKKTRGGNIKIPLAVQISLLVTSFKMADKVSQNLANREGISPPRVLFHPDGLCVLEHHRWVGPLSPDVNFPVCRQYGVLCKQNMRSDNARNTFNISTIFFFNIQQRWFIHLFPDYGFNEGFHTSCSSRNQYFFILFVQ